MIIKKYTAESVESTVILADCLKDSWDAKTSLLYLHTLPCMLQNLVYSILTYFNIIKGPNDSNLGPSILWKFRCSDI